MSIVLKRRVNASTGLALEFTLQKTEWDTPIHVGLLAYNVRVHVEKSYQSTHAACFRDDIEQFRRILAISLGRYFVTFLLVGLCCPLVTTLLFFYYCLLCLEGHVWA